MFAVIGLKPGDVVQNVKTNQRRVVVDVREDMGLIAFDDSALVGWSSSQGWVPTGETSEQTGVA